MNTRTLPAVESEGNRSARRIWSEVPEARSPMPQPYLLTPAGDQVVGNTPHTPRKAHPPLRLIRTSEGGPACGYGTCSLTPECTTKCRYREADEALRGHYSSRHTQRQAMPGEQPATTGPSDENGPVKHVSKWHERLILGALSLVLLLAVALPVAAYLLTR